MDEMSVRSWDKVSNISIIKTHTHLLKTFVLIKTPTNSWKKHKSK